MKDAYLIVGTNFINKGAEAMMKTVAHFIRQQDPEASLHVICHAEEKEIAERQGFVPHYVSSSGLLHLISRVEGKVKSSLKLKTKPYADYSPMQSIKKIKQLRMVIDASGFAYGDKRGYQQPLETQLIIDYCKPKGIPYYFMPQAWGGFKEEAVRQNCRRMLESADGFYARDDQSRAYVAELLERPLEEIPLMPDIAFHFPVPTLDPATVLPELATIKASGKPLLALSPNMRVLERMGKADGQNPYVQTLLALISSLRTQYEVLLVPNEIRPPGAPQKDDAFLCQLLHDLTPEPEKIYRIKGYRSAEEIKAVIKTCHYVIASRFHTLVFALSLGIPSLAISWSHKYRELFKLFQMESFVIEDKEMEASFILKKVEEGLGRHAELSDHIRRTVEALKNTNRPVFDIFEQ
ncbi:hypothetical protein A3SI_12274 [Nitritalea halalkaliphila LW7]|uniref:Polysaccharide pyruvyl transferase domain-containing protein n=1 Tax=Nitritalea halalkaliphila LW7 TaxID=1189621 RepID=I5C1W8_9BACT|nr:polysaccharide pyruvyl transferase family protein [Nitritalea halalkaliphila]EIM75820.1 hypothetical protein A3SI_12274 [Nitritalea halalkaliphila LW7]